MSSIPYNYGKYVDDTVKLRDQGHVDAGKQVQSPASAGSRGLNKTVQFTKDPTQMKMGESITMEDMKSLISRIDGLNVPTNEEIVNDGKILAMVSNLRDAIDEHPEMEEDTKLAISAQLEGIEEAIKGCLLYTSPSPRDQRGSRMPSSA